MSIQQLFDNDILEDMAYDAGSMRALSRTASGKKQTPQEQAWMWRRVDRKNAEIVSQKWIDRPDTRLVKTQRLRWWETRDLNKYQVPDWKLLEDAVNDLRRAVRIKRTGEGDLPGQPSLRTARYNYRCEMLYKQKRGALTNQTSE